MVTFTRPLEQELICRSQPLSLLGALQFGLPDWWAFVRIFPLESGVFFVLCVGSLVLPYWWNVQKNGVR